MTTEAASAAASEAKATGSHDSEHGDAEPEPESVTSAGAEMEPAENVETVPDLEMPDADPGPASAGADLELADALDTVTESAWDSGAGSMWDIAPVAEPEAVAEPEPEAELTESLDFGADAAALLDSDFDSAEARESDEDAGAFVAPDLGELESVVPDLEMPDADPGPASAGADLELADALDTVTESAWDSGAGSMWDIAPEAVAEPEPEAEPTESLDFGADAGSSVAAPEFGTETLSPPDSGTQVAYAPDLGETASAVPVAAQPKARRVAQLKDPALRNFLPILVLQAALVPFRQAWGVELLLVAILLVFPGVLLLRAFRVPGKAITATPVYVPAASLAVLTVTGLVVDLAGRHLLGLKHPISTYPLLIGVEAGCALLMIAARGAPADTMIPWSSAMPSIRRLWSLLIPLAVAVGALRMNNGHSNTVTVLGLSACLVAVIWAFARANRLSNTMLAVILYAVSLAVMWAYSLRGTAVYGFDISNEYRALHTTVESGIWYVSHPGDAYGALPSVTILPAELHFLSGVSALMIFKLLYPAIVAMYPVGVFSFGSRLIARKWAFAGTVLIIAQGAFAQELAALSRQEISFTFFIAMLCAMYDKRLGRWPQWLATAVFTLGMATSHYSTAYFAIGMLTILVILQWISSWFYKTPRVIGAFMIAFVTAAGGAALWYGPITNSTSNISQFVNVATTQGLDILPGQSPGQSIIARYLTGANTQNAMSASQYQQQVVPYYSSHEQFVIPLPDASAPKYDLRDSTVPVPPVRSPSGRSLVALGELLSEQLAEILSVLTVLIMVLHRKTDPAIRQLMLLGVGAVLELGVIRLSATIAAAYNQERAFIQAFAVLGIALGWMLQRLSARLQRWDTRFWRWEHVITAVVATALSVIYLQMGGLSGVLFGGPLSSNLANSGEDYERYFSTVQDVASAQWFVTHVPKKQLYYADRYGALQLNAAGLGETGLLTDVTPMTLDQNAWVYASTTNIVDGRARQYFLNHLVTYKFPIDFLNSNFNVVYTNGAAEVFHG